MKTFIIAHPYSTRDIEVTTYLPIWWKKLQYFGLKLPIFSSEIFSIDPLTSIGILRLPWIYQIF